ncbi:MAG: UPF0182 family protein [Acidobacteria bacterium]|nr:UPF0182 family protein [Acidobacteriota bacterium]
MPESIDWPSMRPPGNRRRTILIVLALALFILFFGRSTLSYYIDALWFASLGYGDVFWKGLRLESTTFLTFFVITFVVLYGFFLALKRAHLPNLPPSRTIYIAGEPLRLPVEPVLRIAGLGACLVVSGIVGAGMMLEWPTLSLWRFAPQNQAGSADPIFGRPLNFYLFTLPAWEVILGWLLALAGLVCAISLLFMFIMGSTRVLSRTRSAYPSSNSSWRGFSVAFAFLLLVLAARTYVARFDRLFEQHTIFSGVTYTDAHIVLPGMLIVSVALFFGFVLSMANAIRLSRLRWLIAAVVPAIFTYIAVQVVASYVSSFIVKPNELSRERPYITNNIEYTRRAYGLDGVSEREFPAETTMQSADPEHNRATLENIRLWDWHALQDTLRQLQEIRTYYDFPDIDIDRYSIGGTERQVMLATRELNVEKLPESSRNWINEKLIYTHGYGITMNPVNGFTPEGLPTFMLNNMPVQSTVAGLNVTRPEIYFGEMTNTDVYVKTRQKEFNYPQGQSNNLTEYEGSGGIPLGGFLRRILIALDQADLTKLPFSDDISGESRLLMRRNVHDRVAALAPFLTYDPDPYIVLGDDGRLWWMMDAFTTSETYPYSSNYRLDDASINYMRNSVKVVINAYDGSTAFYVFDHDDPIVAAYRRIFPTLFKDDSEMPPDLRRHVRYPELLLKMQAAVYGLYHMTNPEVFYNREDLWTVASEVGMTAGGEQATMPLQPNFILMKLPGESNVEFVEILPFTPANRNNLIGWIAGRSDGAEYGKALIYDFPKTRLVDGPLQIEARIDQNAQLSGQLTLWNQQGSHVRRGSLLVIPIGRALLYAEPIYLQAQRSPMPELRLVVLALQDRLAYGPNFESAMSSLFGNAASYLAEGSREASSAPGNAPSQPANAATDRQALIRQAAKDLADYQRLTGEGKLSEAGQKLEQLKRELEQLENEKQ